MRGINFEFAAILLSRNCNVVIADLSLRPEAQKLLDTYTHSPRAVFCKTDVTDWTQLSGAFTTALAEFSCLDIVCPGAGVFEPHWSNFWFPPGSAESKDSVDGLGHYATLDINVSHPIRATQLAISEFLNPSGGGTKVSPSNPKRIVLISSIAGQTAYLTTPLYFASKWAISGFVRSLGDLESTKGIRVNACAPGLIKTPLWTDHPEKMAFVDEGTDQWATAVEVAEAMMRLLEDPAMVGGTILEVGHEQTRVVPQFDGVGPQGSGNTVSNLVTKGAQEVYGWLERALWGRQ